MIRAALFDLDGTVLNTLDDLADSVNFALSSGGHPKHTTDEIRRIVGNGVLNLIRNALPKGASEEEFDLCLNAFKTHYEKNKANKTAPYPGIPELISELRRRGIKIAVVSNKHDDATQGLCKHFFDGLVDYAVGNRAGLEKKPAPDACFAALDALGVLKDDAVFIGDSEVDVKTAKNADIALIAVEWGFRDRETLTSCGAETIASSPLEILDIIEKM